MRFLKRNDAGKISPANFDDDNVPLYAILSHIWGGEEVLFQEMVDSMGKGKLGYRKIQFCADQAGATALSVRVSIGSATNRRTAVM